MPGSSRPVRFLRSFVGASSRARRHFTPAVERLETRRLLAIDPLQTALNSAIVSAQAQPANAIANLGGDLNALYAEHASFAAAQVSALAPGGAAPAFQPSASGLQVVGDRVEVEISAKTTGADLVPQLEALGMRIDGVFGVEASGMIDIDELPALAAAPGVRYVSAAYAPQLNAGSVMSQGDQTQLSDQVRRFLGYNGTGVTVGVLSDSFNALGGYAADVASGDLPANVNVIQDDPHPGGTDEGRAMLQIVHDIAPGAKLAFATDNVGDAGFAANIENLYFAGAKVIVDDANAADEPMFQDGIVAQAVDFVEAHGVSYFVSAGNRNHNSYESPWRSGSPLPDGSIPFNFNASGGSDLYQKITLQPHEPLVLAFDWDSPSLTASRNAGGTAGTSNNIDVFLLDPAAGTGVASSLDDARSKGDPIKLLQFVNPYATPHQFDLAFAWTAGPAPGYIKWIDLYSDSSNITLQVDDYATNSGTLYGHANAAGAMAVGAADYHDTPAYGVSPATLESFSSSGGTPILFDNAGNRYSSAEFRDAPAFVAPDGVSTSMAGFSPFFGTSAAAPSAAAVAALMLQARPNATPSQVRAALMGTAIPMQTPSPNYNTGYGLIDAPAAVLAMGGPFNVSLDAGTLANDGTLDSFRIVRSGNDLDFYEDAGASPVFSGAMAAIGAVYVNGSQDDTNLHIDYSGGAIAPAIYFGGGTGRAFLDLQGDNQSAVTYAPDATDGSAGQLTIQTPGQPTTDAVTFKAVYYAINVTAMSALALRAPNIDNSVTITSTAANQSWIHGSSNGTGFGVSFANIPNVAVDTTSTNGGAPTGDSITIADGGLVASGLKNLSLFTGAGDNTLILQGASLSLPVVGGVLAFATEGKTAHFVSSANANYSLSDAALQSWAGGEIAYGGALGLGSVTLDTTQAPAGGTIWVTPSAATAFTTAGNGGHLGVVLDGAASPALTVTGAGAGTLAFGNRQSVAFTGMTSPSSGIGGFTVSAAEGAAIGMQAVADFIDLTDAVTPANYSAEIDWGDGLSSAGEIAFNAATRVLSVLGNHIYAEQGNYPIGVVLDELSIPVSTVVGAATVSDPAVIATGGLNLPATEGAAMPVQTVATFIDPGGAESLANYSASIAWGDGSTTTGAISFDPASGVFTVQGGHLYAGPSAGTVTVVIQHDSAPAATATDTATVSDPPLAASGGITVSATEGAPFTAPLATFTDPGGALPLSHYSAQIDWGDGATADAGAIGYDAASQIFTVRGSHTYSQEGSDVIHIVLHHDAAPDVSVSSAATVSDPAVVAVGGMTVSGIEGAAFAAQSVATFTDPGGAEALPHYSAEIDWGDGSPAGAGTIGYDVTSQVFTVQGGHTYAEQGSYAVRVTIHHDAAPDVSVTSAATVSDPAVVAAGGLTIAAIEGAAFAAQAVATFTDPGGAEAMSHYSAQIDWGDGATADAGVIVYNAASQVFTVQGGHTYAGQGSDAIHVTIHHDAAPDATATDLATISDPAVVAIGGATISATEGAAFTAQALATFTDPGGAEALSNYSAEVDWGDGATADAGSIAYNGASQVFTVHGGHIYAEQGSYAVQVTIHHDAAPDATATDAATISDPAVVALGGVTISAIEGAAFAAQTVATFTDPGGAEALSHYSANIDWGDGAAIGAGTISYDGASQVFTVKASHKFAQEGSNVIRVVVHHDAAPDATAVSAATVSDPAVNAFGGMTFSATEGAALSAQAVALFTDPGGPEALANYSADID